jgi:molybdopterin converting factor subunit 1
VRVVVRLFAGLRERAGTGEQQVELAEGATAADVWASLRDRLGERPDGLVLAVNRRYAAEDTPLADGDEVALIPPVSGGSPVRLTAEPIDLAAVAAEVADVRTGAIATFSGTTRVESRGRSVRHLDYEAYAGMAEEVMADLVAALKAKYELCDVAIVHRTGRVGIGETSVAIAVSAPHRGDALAACAEAIDTLKQTVPLWKKESYEEGESHWVRGS